MKNYIQFVDSTLSVIGIAVEKSISMPKLEVFESCQIGSIIDDIASFPVTQGTC